MKTTYRNTRYLLGSKNGNSVYLFTGLGEFKSATEASAYWRSKPRNGTAYVFEESDAYRCSVNYGTKLQLVCTAGAIETDPPFGISDGEDREIRAKLAGGW